MFEQVIMNIGEWVQWENKGDMERFSEPEYGKQILPNLNNREKIE